MKEQRLYWDAKNYNVFLERWRAENNGTYYFVNANFKVESTYDTYCSIDDYLYNIGNYFRDEYDAKSNSHDVSGNYQQAEIYFITVS